MAVLEERALFLKSLYDEATNGPPKRQRYVDIGAGMLVNTKVFGFGFEEKYAIDVTRNIWKGGDSKIRFIVGNAQKLPFKARTFDLVTMISVIEHLAVPKQALSEAMLLIRSGGELVIHAPNPKFPIDLHTGLPNPFWIPRFARVYLLRILGYGYWLNDVRSQPSIKDISRWVNGAMRLSAIRGVVYPARFVPKKVRGLYRFLQRIKVFNLLPPSYLYIYKCEVSSDAQDEHNG